MFLFLEDPIQISGSTYIQPHTEELLHNWKTPINVKVKMLQRQREGTIASMIS